MNRSPKVHDTLVYRLSQVLTKLNQGEFLDPQSLAEEFGVNIRTIQRDLNVRFACMPLVKVGGRYRMDTTHLGKLTIKDIEQFAALSGVSGLFPQLTTQFLRGIFDSENREAWMVKGHHYEDLRGKGEIFAELESAIVGHRHVQFNYSKTPTQSKFRSRVEPYKLINQKGIWYLAAWDEGKLKSFVVTKINGLATGETTFDVRPHIDEDLVNSDGIWLGSIRKRVVLRVSSQLAEYFKRRKLISNQLIEAEIDGGDILVSTTVVHSDEVLPIVRYWIPHVQILEPLAFQRLLEASLSDYLAQPKAKP